MAKIRLLEGHRDRLRYFAKEIVQPRAELKALTKAYDKAAPIVKKIVETKYPPTDMATLTKYQLSERDDCVKLQLTAGGVDEFQFKDTDAPVVPGGYSCRTRIYLADEKATAAVQIWIAARDAYETERKKRIADYYALIAAARTTEDLITVWPEARDHLPKGQEVVAVNNDVLARIAADLKERAKAA